MSQNRMQYNEWKRKFYGTQMQELVGLKLEKYFPPSEWMIVSNGTFGADLWIQKRDTGEAFSCEVKSALNYVRYTAKTKAGKKQALRRGRFNIKAHQVQYDFYAFVVRFTDAEGHPNGNHETYFVMGKEIQEKFINKPISTHYYRLTIPDLQEIGTKNFDEIKANFIY